MKYLVIDAVLGGTGIRDKHEGGYIAPESLGLSYNVLKRLKEWLLKYENEHYKGFENNNNIDILDGEGKEIAFTIKSELGDVKMEYFSDARMTIEVI